MLRPLWFAYVNAPLSYQHISGYNVSQQQPLLMINESDKRLNLVHDKRMKPIMKLNDLNTIEQMEQFLTGN
jgi:hypothetical protein